MDASTELRGRALLSNRYHNKATAFTQDERDRLGLHGLLPPVVETLETQLLRVRLEYDAAGTDLNKHVFLRQLRALNSVLFYRFLADHIAELLPIVYTPVVGLACQEWSHTWRREHGLYITWEDRLRMDEVLLNVANERQLDAVVVSDGERILGLGDLGVGGMGIPIGKLALYTCIGGIDPERTMPVLLDTGTDNEALLSDPLYLGSRRHRLRDDEYDELVDTFVASVQRCWPGVLLQWEDFAQRNAARLLARHRDELLSFNDDIQGTAAVAVGAITAGLTATNRPVTELIAVIVGAGSAGLGIANEIVRALVAAGLPELVAVSHVYLVDQNGLLHSGMDDLHPGQVRFARPWEVVKDWDLDGDGRVELVEVVAHAGAHALVGVTGVPGLFTEDVVRTLASTVERPIVLPLSNPTPRCEGTPAEVLAWTGGRALVGTGSPFAPVTIDGMQHVIAQVNNAYVFPGVGLGVVAVKAHGVSDAMMTAAATALGELSPAATAPGAPLLPPLGEARAVARHVAVAVARQAVADGLTPTPLSDDEIDARIAATVWDPVYQPC